MTLKKDAEVPKWNIKHLQATKINKQKKWWMKIVRPKSSWYAFLLFQRNYPLHVWSLRISKGPSIILNKFWNVYDSTFSRKKGQIFGKRSGFHILTVYSKIQVFVQTTDTSLTVYTSVWYKSQTFRAIGW